MPEVELLMLPEEQRRAARARPPMPDIVAQQGAIADAVMRQPHATTRIATRVSAHLGSVGAARAASQPSAASTPQGQSCTHCTSGWSSTGPGQGQIQNAAAQNSQAPLLYSGSCPYGPTLYASQSGSPDFYTWIDLNGCDYGVDCSTSTDHKCCYPPDRQCEEKICAWGPVAPPLYDRETLEAQTPHIDFQGFACDTHVDLLRAAFIILMQAAIDEDFFDWLMCAFEASDGVNPGAVNVDRWKSLVRGTNAAERLRVFMDTSDPLRTMAWVENDEGQLDPWIGINAADPLFGTMAGAWNWGTDDERICAALRASAVLGHELLHIVGATNTIDNHNIGPGWNSADMCSHWHIFMNTYMWTFVNRLQWVAGGPACCNFGSAYHFFSDCEPLDVYLNYSNPVLWPWYCVASNPGPGPWGVIEVAPNYVMIQPVGVHEWLCSPFVRAVASATPIMLP